MSELNKKRVKIAIGILLAFFLSSTLTQSIFSNPLRPVIDINYFFLSTKSVYDNFSQKMQDIAQQVKAQPTPTVSQLKFANNSLSIPITTITPSKSPTTTMYIPPPTQIPSSTPKPTATPIPKGDTVIFTTDNDSNQGNDSTSSSYSCPNSSNESYGSLSIISAKTANPQSHADINFHIRGYTATQADKKLIDMPGDTDVLAPQLTTLLSGDRFPKIVNTYKVYEWNWSTNKKGGLISKWDVTLIGLSSKSGQKILLPNSGYNIGGGFQTMVLYAEKNTITLKYTREDNVVSGYTLHLDDICVDPNLLAKYNELNGKGRSDLPAIKGGQKIGMASGSEVKVAIRDTGEFMDPRVKKDWWAR